ncbi:MAG TPA: hypothetical protein PLO73_04700 [Spirochaetota bacterium]|nr:hypothetical protein [Spirochaetota bacterium]HOM09396.1 hypothetical protein [Spirochaetota bacterium]HPP49251.1 hypothetical protein [Spirochaetota bacterium]
MKAIRKIVKPVNNKIIITLKDNNEADEYEVIILPVENKNNQKIKSKKKFLDLAGKINIDSKTISKLREKSIL